MMHQGELSRGQMQAWALNRYYYQSRIPIKDAIILSRSEDPDFRRAWRKRVVDHDGDSAQEGGIERWIRLAEAAGLDRQRVMHCDGVLPAIRYAVDAYLDLVRNRSFLEAVASSLTELFSRELIALRMDRLCQHYPWLSSGLDYFTERLHQAPEDARFALQLCHRARAYSGRAGTSDRGTSGEVRYSLGPTGRAVFRLCPAGMAAAGGLSDGVLKCLVLRRPASLASHPVAGGAPRVSSKSCSSRKA